MLFSTRWIFCSALAALLVLPAAAVAELYPCAQPPHKLILLRHAPKANDSDDSPLSMKGWEEAGKLVPLLGEEPIGAIYVSTKRRTQQTAMPLAEYLQVRPVVIADTEQGTAELLARICQSRRTETVVYVGHSYTLDKVFAAFGFDEPPKGGEPVHEIAFGPRGPKLSQIR